ncbi:MAG: hypothetical protein FWH03_04150 [Firmicutes bacterium]|nr:hypothetical protein [Bacillota bacterium]
MIQIGEFFINFIMGFGVVSVSLLTAGLVLVLVEIFRRSKGAFGITGAVLTAAGISVRMLNGGTAAVLLLMLLLCAALILFAHLLSLRFQKRQWLYQSLNLLLRGASEKKDDYAFLTGLNGVAATDISNSGSMVINDVTFFVTSERFIQRGSTVRVASVDGERILVEPNGRE